MLIRPFDFFVGIFVDVYCFVTVNKDIKTLTMKSEWSKKLNGHFWNFNDAYYFILWQLTLNIL